MVRVPPNVPSNALLAAVLDATSDLVIVFDANGHIHELNTAADRLLGRARESWLGTPLTGFVQQVLGDGVRLRVEIIDAGRVGLDPASFEQLMLNLVLNARDALEGGGSVTIEASTVATAGDAATVPDLTALPAGRYQRLSVADNGSGIAPAHLERVFDPFFTTKEHDRGTALGLFTSRSAVQSAGGEMTVTSDESGTVFNVYLPALDDPRTN